MKRVKDNCEAIVDCMHLHLCELGLKDFWFNGRWSSRVSKDDDWVAWGLY